MLHVIPSLSPARGGPTQNLRVTARALAAAGVEVQIATTDDDGPRARLKAPPGGVAREEGVTIHYFPRQTGFYSFSLPLTLWLWQNVRYFDLVHIHALFNYPALAAGFVARMRGVPYILRPLGTLSSWGLRMRRPLLKRLSFLLFESRLLANAAAVHCTSEKERGECSGYRAVVVPNPVHLDSLEPLESDGKTILFVGRLDAVKGLDLLLPAFAQTLAARPEVKLLIVGDGEAAFVAALKASIVALGLAHAVDFAGFLTGEARRRVWRRASVFVLPSRTENFGVSAAEAMERGLPVVVSDQVGIQTEVVAWEAGLVVPCEPGQLAEALIRLLNDAGMRQRLGRNGRAAAEKLFSPPAVARSLQELYLRVSGVGSTHA